MTEQEFRLAADDALERAHRALMALADERGFELEFQNGVLQLEFEEPTETKFVVSPNAPVREIWVSAMAASSALVWASSPARPDWKRVCCWLVSWAIKTRARVLARAWARRGSLLRAEMRRNWVSPTCWTLTMSLMFSARPSCSLTWSRRMVDLILAVKISAARSMVLTLEME